MTCIWTNGIDMQFDSVYFRVSNFNLKYFYVYHYLFPLEKYKSIRLPVFSLIWTEHQGTIYADQWTLKHFIMFLDLSLITKKYSLSFLPRTSNRSWVTTNSDHVRWLDGSEYRVIHRIGNVFWNIDFIFPKPMSTVLFLAILSIFLSFFTTLVENLIRKRF